ncbi:restriction endonuclease subunit S [Prevotella sp. E9-3]|uniref:restriction endonuclease subunit S n=1 Tax=Prevotella sp. E9-3 TaxID=2913621 RepID=UPI00351CD460
MERYSSYKPTYMQGFEEIPSHWNCIPVKRVCSMKSGNNITSLDILDEGPYPVFGANGMRGYYNRYNVDGDYLLIGRQGALSGNVHHYNGKFWATDHALITYVRREDINYVYYALIAINLNQYAFGTAAQPGLAASKIMALSIPLPPLAEQEKIVSYLEDKTSKIDAYVADKEKEIELLQELKQKTIADAVTKGLNPDAKMKDSGISWIGEIPEHWVQYRFATLFKEKSICNHVNEELLSVYLDRGVIRFSEDNNKRTNPTSKDLSKYQLVDIGDFVLNNQQAWRGSVGVSRYRGIISPAYFIFEMSSKLNPLYANYLLRSTSCVAYYYICSKGIGSIQRNLDWSSLKQKKLAIPPLNEQQSIVAYIEEKCEKIDKLASELQSEIDYLKEYKQRLIADCVTGQINVQNEMI